MAINFVPGQVAVGDPNPGGPSALSNVKDVKVCAVKLTSANFATTNVDTLVAVLPADSTIIDLSFWVRTQLAGGGITAATLSLGSSSGGTQFTNATNVFGAAGTQTKIASVSGILQNYQQPLGPDINIWARGTATTGNPTSGEIYVLITYVR